MGNKKTSTKQKKSLKRSTSKKLKVGGMTFEEFSPSQEMASKPSQVAKALSEALLEGDKEAFQEILEAYVKAREIAKVARKVKISRAVIYEAIDKKKNPSLDSVCKIMKAFKNAETKGRAA